MKKNKNQFTDSFKILGESAKNLRDIGKKITSVLNKELPNRILSKANIFNMTLDVSQDLSKMIMLHVEDSLIEQNMLIAQKDLSVRGLSTLTGHIATRPISSDGILKLLIYPNAYQNTPILVFQDLILKCETNGLKYLAKNEYFTTSNSLTTFIPVIEGSWVRNEIFASGDKLETINLDDTNAIENNHMKISVNSEKYEKFDSIYDMGVNSKGFVLKNGIGNQVDVIFGDGVHGLKLNSGDSIVIEHFITNGEQGNIENLLDAKWSIVSGVYDINGNSIDINDYCVITCDSGFVLGSNGEDIELTRAISGYSSRAMVLAKPENLIAYLSRLSILSYIDVWTNTDDNIYNVLLLPNIEPRIKEYKDYLKLTDFKLNDNQKNSIIEYINGSGKQQTKTEILWCEPEFTKYVVFVYVTGNILDKQSFKSKVENEISRIFLENTFIGKTNDGLISQNEIIEAITNIDNITQCNIDVFSEKNEIARINGYYTTTEETIIGSTKSIVTVEKVLDGNENPNIGFDELGGISTQDKKQIPILRGGFQKYDNENNHINLENPIYIFYKNNNGDFEAII